MNQMADLKAAGIGMFGVGLMGFLSCTGAGVPDDPLVITARNVCLGIMFLGAIFALSSSKRRRG